MQWCVLEYGHMPHQRSRERAAGTGIAAALASQWWGVLEYGHGAGCTGCRHGFARGKRLLRACGQAQARLGDGILLLQTFFWQHHILNIKAALTVIQGGPSYFMILLPENETTALAEAQRRTNLPVRGVFAGASKACAPGCISNLVNSLYPN